MPPSNSNKKLVLEISVNLTPVEGVFEGKGVVDSETISCATGEAALVLVKTHVEYFLLLTAYHFCLEQITNY